MKYGNITVFQHLMKRIGLFLRQQQESKATNIK